MTSSTIRQTQTSTDPGVKTPAQAIRLDRAAALVAIARLIVDNNLPAPHTIGFRFYQETKVCLDLDFDTAEQAEAWTAHFGGRVSVARTYQPDWRDGPIRSHRGHIYDTLGFYEANFNGWTPAAVEPAPPVVDPDPTPIRSSDEIQAAVDRGDAMILTTAEVTALKAEAVTPAAVVIVHKTTVFEKPEVESYPDLHPGHGWSCLCGAGQTSNPVETDSPVGYMDEGFAQELADAHMAEVSA